MFVESVLKYNSFIEIVFQNTQLIISPTDHMDIFIHSNNIVAFKNIVSSNVKEFCDILTYELNI